MDNKLRPPAVPLVTVDPYFSVWSMADRLTDDDTRHWTGRRHGMTGLLRIDGTVWRFAGRVEPNAEVYYTEPAAMRQTGLRVDALSTRYEFEADGVSLSLRFTTPLLPDDLDLLSRPASYVGFEVRSTDGRPRDVQLYFDVTGEWCVNDSDQKVVWGEKRTDGLRLLHIEHEDQRMLTRSGDDLRIEWGRFYLACAEADGTRTRVGPASLRKAFVRGVELRPEEADSFSMPRAARGGYPVLSVEFDLGRIGDGAEAGTAASRLVTLAYDDVLSIEYFGDRLPPYWRRNGDVSAEKMIVSAVRDYEAVSERCETFGRQLRAEAEKAGGAEYADLLELSYRQAVAAHKLVADREGSVLFLSKECYSNGCIATVDVSYPSMPLFLLYNPELVRGMMRPIFKFAASDAWAFDFAPHDAGQYPLANGQVYAQSIEGQMPVEECGNMLIMAAAVSLADGKIGFAEEHADVLRKWADYLAEHGLDPENQLCTDDFAGHLARNANLSVKAAMGVAAYAILCRLSGREEDAARYLSRAREMAVAWEELAADGQRYRLAFGQEGTWSLKYNLVWDLLFGTELFGRQVREKEVIWYLARRQRYGTPLDSRENYTKSDWLVWAASLAEEDGDFRALVEPLWRFANETPDRVPLTDWYRTDNGRQMNFQHRSVVGGLFIKVLKDRWAGRRFI
ncbi:DUF4965 domain-containing protein [Cohnella xylanilytica]|uniref:DUF4965 domain-containing protein n=1 Tax=Cohnella xylanilytica TaxID=557555 RepID=A0A841U4P5_9BACL|nr:glutaminase family protein [Cohnella xylanilytica]MBB6694532.1 DUF4965 domain-containing protein [Cohnella xylanilytica]